MFFAFVLVPCWLAFMLYIPYVLVKKLQKRTRLLVRTWIICFSLEMITIIFLPLDQMEMLGLQRASGFSYWIAFTKGLNELIPIMLHGHGRDFWQLLITPVIPALIAFWIVSKEHPPVDKHHSSFTS